MTDVLNTLKLTLMINFAKFFPKKKKKFSHCYQQQSLVTGINGQPLSHTAPMVTLPEVFPNISQTTNNSPPQDHPHRESIKRKASTNLYKAESNVFGSHVFMFKGIES